MIRKYANGLFRWICQMNSKHFVWNHGDIIKQFSYSILNRINWSGLIANTNEGVAQFIKGLSQLSIMDPRGLFAGTECLTFVENGLFWKKYCSQSLIKFLYVGRLVYFLGFSKGTDDRRRVYDPMSDLKSYAHLKKKSDLDRIGR